MLQHEQKPENHGDVSTATDGLRSPSQREPPSRLGCVGIKSYGFEGLLLLAAKQVPKQFGTELFSKKSLFLSLSNKSLEGYPFPKTFIYSECCQPFNCFSKSCTGGGAPRVFPGLVSSTLGLAAHFPLHWAALPIDL